MRTSHVPAIRPMLAAAASLALLGALGTPAQAASTSDTDPAGDVVATSGGAATPNNQTADITALAVTHGTGAVTVRVGLRQLAADNWNLVTAIQTPKARYEVLLADLGGSRYEVLSRKGTAISCKGLDRTIDADGDSLTVVVPRRCIGKPGTVRIGAVMTAKQGDVAVSDDARITGGLTKSRKPKLGPKVSAG